MHSYFLVLLDNVSIVLLDNVSIVCKEILFLFASNGSARVRRLEGQYTQQLTIHTHKKGCPQYDYTNRGFEHKSKDRLQHKEIHHVAFIIACISCYLEP